MKQKQPDCSTIEKIRIKYNEILHSI